MKRLLLRVVAGLTGTAALIFAALAIAADGAETAPVRRHGESYNESPAPLRHEDHVHQNADGTWASRSLPYAKPFPSREALEEALTEARRLGLIR
jgi:hypothetical protein